MEACSTRSIGLIFLLQHRPPGATPRLLRVDEGNTITDYDEEAVARRMTINTSVAIAEWTKGADKVKINILKNAMNMPDLL